MEEIERLRAEVEFLKMTVLVMLESIAEPLKTHVKGEISKVAESYEGRMLFSEMTDEQLGVMTSLVDTLVKPL